MAVLDVAGAPVQVRLNAKPGDTVVVVGAGKAGLLCLQEAIDRVYPSGNVVCVELSNSQCRVVRDLGIAHKVIQANAQNPLETFRKYKELLGEKLADLTISCVNVPDTETTSVLMTKKTGLIYYFSMSTNFAKASLGAEGIGKQTKMLIGNGYYPGHADIVFQVVREHPRLRAYFEEKYAV